MNMIVHPENSVPNKKKSTGFVVVAAAVAFTLLIVPYTK